LSANADTAREILDAGVYMTLATADEFGRSWPSPVFFAHRDYRELFWVSHIRARHSRNIGERTQLGIVVFDAHLALYMTADAEQLHGDDIAPAIAVLAGKPLPDGRPPWTAEDVSQPDGLRAYRAVVSEHWLWREDAADDGRRSVIL
jgi:hypothetical protein